MASNVAITPVDGAMQKVLYASTKGTLSSEIPRLESFCTHALAAEDTLVVRDTAGDPRFATNPSVTGEPNIRFYAGEPIEYDGQRLGKLCLLDPSPRALSLPEPESLRSLARRDVARLQREERPCGLLMIDLDNFNQLNVQRGQVAGDAALRMRGQRLRSAARPAGVVARFEGYAFLAWLGGSAACQVEEVAERMSARVCDEPLLDEPEYTASVTIGCAAVALGEVLDLETIINRARTALLAAKQAGRGGWQTLGARSAPLSSAFSAH